MSWNVSALGSQGFHLLCLILGARANFLISLNLTVLWDTNTSAVPVLCSVEVARLRVPEARGHSPDAHTFSFSPPGVSLWGTLTS